MLGTAELAEGWDTHTTEQGVAYYHNRVTGETTWQAATAASPAGTASSGETDTIGGWEAVWSDQHQMYYYCNRATGEAQWDNPAPQQTASDRGPPPPYSPTPEAQQQHGKGVAYNGSSTSGGAADAAGSPPPYSSEPSQESPTAAAAAAVAMAGGAGAEPRAPVPTP
ncbi:unnamed protein product, partial [Ectocarpus fasciculatus]